MNRRQKIIVSVTGIFIVLLALVGLTYAYFLTQIRGNDKTESISVTTADLKVEYQDGDATYSTGDEDELIYPGFWAIKKFSVENLGTKDANYAIILDNVVNEFERAEDWQYELKYDGQTKTGTLKNSGTQILIESINIPIETKTDYELKLIYNDPDEDQSVDMNKNLSLRVNITNEFQTMTGEQLKATTDNNVLTLTGNTIMTSSMLLDTSIKTIDLNNHILILNPTDKDDLVYLDSQTPQEIKNGTIMRGENLVNGSLIHSYGEHSKLTLTNVIVDGNNVDTVTPSISNQRDFASSGVHCFDCYSLIINDSQIINNYGDGSGIGIKANSHGPLTISNSIIANNKITSNSGQSGAAIRATSDNVQILNTIIENNVAEFSLGTVDLSDADLVNFDSKSIVRNNVATSASGLYMRDVANGTIAGRIEGNKATKTDSNGGGVYTLLNNSNYTVKIESTAVITGNSAASGGGVYVNGPASGVPGKVIMNGGTIEANTAYAIPAQTTFKDGGGAGIYVARGIMEIKGGIVQNNISTSETETYRTGSAILVSHAGRNTNGGKLTISGGTIKGSVVVPEGYGTLTLENVTQNGDLIS